MKRCAVWVSVLACAAVFAWTADAVAELTPGQKQAVEALIKDFGSKEFAVRQKAVDRLIEIGIDVAPLVKKTLAETTDNEVKLRCEMVLKGLREKLGAAAVDGPKTEPAKTETPKPEVKVTPGKDFPPTKVTIGVKDGQLQDIAQKFADESRNAAIRLPQDWDGTTETLEVKNMNYWEALDKLCKSAGLVYDLDYSRTTGQISGLAFRPLGRQVDIGAYAGPAVVKVMSGSQARTLRSPQVSNLMGVMGFFNLPPTRDVLSYSLVYFWEDHLPVLKHEAEVTAALAPGAKALTVPQPKGPAAMMMMGWGGPGAKPFYGWANATIIDVPDGLTEVAELIGVVKLTYGSGEKTMKIDDALNAAGKSVTDGDVTITITKVNKQGNFVQVIVKVTKDGKEYTVPVYPNNPEYGFLLMGADGTKLRGGVSGGSAGPTAGGGLMPGGTYTGTPQSNTRGGTRTPTEPGETSIGFSGNVDGVWTLIYTRPGDVWTKEYPFKLTNVPLP